jgi:hypothetical protein
MTQPQRNFEPCLYPSLCGGCNGIPASVVVHLISGETFEFPRVLGIDLTSNEIVLRPAVGEPMRFERNNVLYAGCGQVVPPMAV